MRGIVVLGRSDEDGLSGSQESLNTRSVADILANHGSSESGNRFVAIEDAAEDDGGSASDLLSSRIDSSAESGVDEGVSVDTALGDLVGDEVFMLTGGPRNVDGDDILASEVGSVEIINAVDVVVGLLNGVVASQSSTETEENDGNIRLEVLSHLVGVFGEEEISSQASDVTNEVAGNAVEVEDSLRKVFVASSYHGLNSVHVGDGVLNGNGSTDLDTRNVLLKNVEFGKVGDEELDGGGLGNDLLGSLSNSQDDGSVEGSIPRKVLVEVSKSVAVDPINIVSGSLDCSRSNSNFFLMCLMPLLDLLGSFSFHRLRANNLENLLVVVVVILFGRSTTVNLYDTSRTLFRNVSDGVFDFDSQSTLGATLFDARRKISVSDFGGG